ncbi:hypothetical protein B9T23_13745 [Acinetobacter terrae]|uniref:hypothetical protein n=1 Tax=Acinetobacter terrae TaxID=2731247 RepID=UPI000A34DBB2|nr:hypothetical protein [Acinetobacter terrae]OTG73410.1 hypothetical protein B9T23_13745 [Acinetobacter terrae]
MGLFSVVKILASLLYQLWGNLSDEDKDKIKQKCRKMLEDLIRAYYRKDQDRSNGGAGEKK